MRRANFGAVFGLICALAGMAQAEWSAPPRGSAERRAIMDAIRPRAEKLYGAPVEFMVGELRVSGDLAFAMVGVQRPGGGAIDLYATPGWRAGAFMEDADNFSGQALLIRRGGRWTVKEITFGATDVWWSYGPICKIFRPVIAEYCEGL